MVCLPLDQISHPNAGAHFDADTTACPLDFLRAFSASPLSLDKALPPRPKILESDLVEAFLRGSGPGGQKINKTSCAVQLKHIPTGIVVKCQETRSRELNRKFARQILAEKLDVLEKGDESRSAIKGERARVKKASASKKAKRKYRKLDEEKGGIEQDGAESDEQGHGTGGTAVDDVSARSAGASPGGDDVRGPT
ncbi:hypothetical protein LTR91_010608 [Friedmanniomyces endolithicus]|uniref:Prokaryotic-type class I peptide chain release factors domain-containing protein n=1 Tax=Friedmanniomyces endolithicus TaxID=329885 RepID=A0AAN6QSH4_9PEZI|nr:hypothetical protein LTS09_015211 [Friedmanniomyces endolithicus]KAK0269046.1 hypothetical protein LTR35_015141 [Friedmanniomyces endolithicus]KAK0286443.1 hypothetical protein LTS00_010381 [Friedmanniomyces endolithicus]KAK0306048.1 hypothetical protein LTR01_006396 [Friedmanniomyces endolithicus]KAK0828239.1 hypothetical protein LTR73_005192 [Friedmanniomyces endolithicus]